MIETRAGDGSVEPTYAIRRWGRNRIEAGGAGKRVLLMPDGDEDLWNDSYLDLVAEE